MRDLIFSFNATMPVFLMMVIGFFLRSIHWIDDEFASRLNRFVFKLPLPILVFSQLATTDFRSTWDGRFVLFCFLATLCSITLVALISLLIKNASRGEFVQASYRSSAALLGIAYITNIYGEASMSALMILGSVPLYNIMAVVVLTITSPENKKLSGSTVQKTLFGIIKNPIIIGIALGMLWSVLRIPMPHILDKTVHNIGSIASPLGLIAMGASIKPDKISGALAPALVASFFKLVGLAAIFLPIAISLGFRTDKLIAILIMLGSATTVSSFVMARSMGHEGTLTSNTVVITTLLSAFTLTGWIYILKVFNLI
ncbi:MAG: AEC family transporter [Agathobacter sp.]|uniref:AEC family transporter n=1 Tax=Agathobacter sp. TaxID=2021311 RepID=UPI00258FC078|nr:AEC family transporter [Agathobacter sp.]MCR5677211.1 AEC family transporter [Agathobacter sp.]